LADVAEKHGSLENCSAFKFENFLGQLKKKVRPGHKPLVQLAKRLRENPIKSNTWKQEKLSVTAPNNVYLTATGEIIELAEKADDGTYIYRRYTRLRPAVAAPVDTTLVGFLECPNGNLFLSFPTDMGDTKIVAKVWKHTVPGVNRVLFMVLNHCSAFAHNT
jgi:hypothetical protein